MSARRSLPGMSDAPLPTIASEVYLAHLDRESRRFSAVLAGVDPAVRVPTCPDWSSADLLWHLTEVQWFWGSIAGRPVIESADIELAEAEKPDRPAAYPELLTLFETARERLAAAVEDGSDDLPRWSWAADRTLGFIRRRQAHEALIHRVDAELSAGVPVEPFDAALAADGVDELLRVMWAAMPGWASFSAGGGVIAIECTDTAHSWLIELGRMSGTSPKSGTTYDEPTIAMLGPGTREPDARVRARAGDLDRWLWNRDTADSAGIELTGSERELDGLAALIAGGVQ